MKIPYRDSRNGMARRWTDHQRILKNRFFELYETIEECNEIGKDELIKLRDLVDKKIHVCTSL